LNLQIVASNEEVLDYNNKEKRFLPHTIWWASGYLKRSLHSQTIWIPPCSLRFLDLRWKHFLVGDGDYHSCTSRPGGTTS